MARRSANKGKDRNEDQETEYSCKAELIRKGQNNRYEVRSAVEQRTNRKIDSQIRRSGEQLAERQKSEEKIAQNNYRPKLV